MDSSGFGFATPLRVPRSSLLAIGLALALVVTGALAAANPVRGAAPAALKAVFIVGPAGTQTAADLVDAEALATQAETYGMDVRRVFHPHATWDNVMANIQGANLVYYAGHGYGWPSPYTKVLTEARQDGVGLNTFDGSSTNTYTYYGATVLRENWVLAPNAIVFLNHDCYTGGNGEPGAAIPTWDVARQRVDNFASGFLAVGARAVFALSYQRFTKVLTNLMTTDMTMEDLFRIPGAKPTPVWGWVGWDPRKFDSVRTPGAKNFMDPHAIDGFLRAVTGDLTMTAADWARGVGDGQPPEISNFAAENPGVNSFGPGETPFFTPNGDGVTDSLELSFTVDREAFVDMEVKNGSGGTVRMLSAWSPGGTGKTTWDGKNSNGAFVPDGDYSVTATPRNRAGTTGNVETVNVKVMTTMRSPATAPSLFYPADGDNLARTTNLSVNLQEPATFWWKIADKNGNVVRTFVNGVNTPAGSQTQQWDGKDGNGAYVPEGTYYSVMTTQTSAGTYYHSLPVDVKAFRLTTAVATPFVRGTKAKFYVYSAEPLSSLTPRPKVKVFAPGLAVKSYSTSLITGGGGWQVTVSFPLAASAGTIQIRAQGTDTGAVLQWTDYYFPLQ